MNLEVNQKGRLGIQTKIFKMVPYSSDMEICYTLNYKNFFYEQLRPLLKYIVWMASLIKVHTNQSVLKLFFDLKMVFS